MSDRPRHGAVIFSLHSLHQAVIRQAIGVGRDERRGEADTRTKYCRIGILLANAKGVMVIGRLHHKFTMSSSIMFRAAAKATASVQVALTAISLLHGTYASTLPPDNEEGWMLDRHAKLYAWLPQLDFLVVEAYMGHGISPRYMCLPPTSGGSSTDASNNGANNNEDSRTFIKLGNDATFEDSAVICSGPEEIAEAFRALRVARPEFIRHPHRIDVKESRDGDGRESNSASAVAHVTYYMHQRYAGILTVKSLLHVTVDKCDDSRKARIVKIVEEWNGVKPLEYPPFFLSRRINGMFSWWLTSLLVR